MPSIVKRGMFVALFAAALTFVSSAAEESGDLNQLSITQLQKRHADIDAKLAILARVSLNSGVGPIGYRSLEHPEADHREWLEIDLGEELEVDEIVLVPTLWNDVNRGFVSDGFPAALKIIAFRGEGEPGFVVADFPDTSGLLPRVAPLVVPAARIKASRIRIEADRLSRRAFDGKYILQISEILVFSGGENKALRRPVRSPAEAFELAAWKPRYVVDGILPYVMNSGRGDPSLASLSLIGIGDRPLIEIDLQEEKAISGIRIHAVDQSDTVPQAFPGDYGVPRSFMIEASDEANFSDPELLLEVSLESSQGFGPIMEWRFPETAARRLRLTALEPYFSKEFAKQGTRIGFAEIEVLSNGENIALGAPVAASFGAAGPDRRLAALTDGRNLYGRILPLREWLGELAQRHDLEAARPAVLAELSGRYAGQRSMLTWMFVIAGVLVLGIAALIIHYHFRGMRQEAHIRERIGANLHDELGANLHAIGLLGDLAKDSVDSPEDLIDTLDRIRSLTERTGSAARNCANMLAAKGVCEDPVEEMRRDSQRLLADLEHSITYEGGEILRGLPRRKRIDLYLFHKESLVNIIRHSGATEVSTRVVASQDQILVTINDNGIGINGGPPPSLKRRARLLGADFRVEQPASGGTIILLNLKIRKFKALK